MLFERIFTAFNTLNLNVAQLINLNKNIEYKDDYKKSRIYFFVKNLQTMFSSNEQHSENEKAELCMIYISLMIKEKSTVLDVINTFYLCYYRQIDFCLTIQKYVLLYDI